MQVVTKRVKDSSKVTTERSAIYRGTERRRKPRLFGRFAARVRGVDAEGQAFESDVFADNISASGLHFPLHRRIERGTRLFILVRLPGAAASGDSGPLIAAYGDVVRSEPQANDMCGVAVSLKRQGVL